MIFFFFINFKLLMGFFFYFHSVALVEDLGLKEDYSTLNAFYTAVDRAYLNVRTENNILLYGWGRTSYNVFFVFK